MNRHRRPLVAVLVFLGAAAVTGCARIAPPPDAVPAAIAGTWRGDQGTFITLGGSQVILSLAGIPRAAHAITASTVVGSSVALTLDNGWILAVAAGRGLQVRHQQGVDLAADCPVIDLGLSGPASPLALRLVADNNAMWLPVAMVTQAPPAVTVQADPQPGRQARLLTAVQDADPRVAGAARELAALAQGGADAAALDAAFSEDLRTLRLALLDLLGQAGADDRRLAAADHLQGDIDTFAAAYHAWR